MAEYISYASSDYANFDQLINEHRIIDKTTKVKCNFMDQATDSVYFRKTYNIPPENMDSVIDALNIMCIKNNGMYCFSERQLEEENGIFIDIDAVNPTNVRSYDDFKLKAILEDYIGILLRNMSNLGKNEGIKLHAFIMAKEKTLYSEKKRGFKEGYHILIPDLYLTKKVRQRFLKELNEEYPDVDVATGHNPSMYYGNCKSDQLIDRDTYKIKTQKMIHIYEKRGHLKFDLEEYKLDEDNCNIIRELSLTHNGTVLKANIVKIKNDDSQETIQDDSVLENEDQQDVDSLEELKRLDPDSRLLCDILDIMHSKYYDERMYWWKVLCGIYNYGISKNYKYDIVAKWFSEKSTKYDEDVFYREWVDIRLRHSSTSGHITIGTLRYYAKDSDPIKYASIKKKYDTTVVKTLLTNNVGLQHFNVGMMLYNITGKSIFHTAVNDSKNTWCVYIDTPGMKIQSEDGQLHKWVNEGHESITLSMFMSTELVKVFNAVVRDYDLFIKVLEERVNKSVTDIENLKEKRKRVIKICSKLCDNGYKKSVLNECRCIFHSPNALRLLDRNERVLGVKNGILILPLNKTEVLQHNTENCSEYMIESYTNVNYVAYDPNNEYVKALYNILNDIITEPDALEYILIYLSTSLHNASKEALMFMFRGGGSNGKSTLLELMLNTLGSMYSKKFTLGLLTDGRESSQNANSAFMDLKNARFGYFSEPNKVERINTGRLKEILGNEKLTGRQLYGKQENFENKCNLIAASNYDFEIVCNDHGIWRRIKYYEFKVRFVESPSVGNNFEKKLNKKMISNIIKDENYLEAFLSILVHYYTKYIYEYDGDINNVKSPTIDYETNCYRGRQDYMQRFISEKVTITEPGDNVEIVTLEEFAQLYNLWYITINKITFKTTYDCKDVIPIIENCSISPFIKTDRKTYSKYFDNILISEIKPIL